jgi:hypothetical protein
MAVLTKEAIRSEPIIILSRQITRNAPIGNKLAEASLIFDWVVHNVRYVKDTNLVETLISPVKLITEVGAGDCDDLSMLLAALFESVGTPARFVAVKTLRYDKSSGNFSERSGFSHVYTEGWLDGKWIIFDAASASPAIGKTTPSSGERLIQPISVTEEMPPSMDAFQSSAKLALLGGALIAAIFMIYLMFRKKKYTIKLPN